MSLNDTYTLSNGVKIPVIGFGTWQAPDGDVAYQSVRSALDNGYRHIDTAAIYGNEVSVGRAIADSGIARHELFITTKLWNDAHDYDSARQAFQTSLDRLGLDYVDLYLIHWPNPKHLRQNNQWEIGNAEAWRAMEDIYQAGKARAIGVSNFQISDLKSLEKHQSIAPMVNQNFLNPSDQQSELVQYNQQHNILNEAYSPLGTGKLLSNPVIENIAQKYNKSVAQILIRWSLDKGFLPLPKSTHADYIKANTDVFDFSLSSDDIQHLDNLSGSAGLHLDASQADF